MAGGAGEKRPAEPQGGKQESTDFGFLRVPWAEKAALVRAVFDGVADRYDLMNDLMSLGIHRLWREAMVDWLAPRPGIRLLDMAGGTGDIALRVLKRCDRLERAARDGARGAAEESVRSATRVIVCDASESMIAVGRDRALDRGIWRIAWACADAERVPLRDRSVDAYTVAFGLRNVTDKAAALAEARRVIKPGGRFLCLEFSHVVVPFLEACYARYSFSVVPALGEIVTGRGDAYRYLVESIRRFPDQEGLAEMIRAAGFGRVTYRNLTGGVAALHSAWRI